MGGGGVYVIEGSCSRISIFFSFFLLGLEGGGDNFSFLVYIDDE